MERRIMTFFVGVAATREVVHVTEIAPSLLRLSMPAAPLPQDAICDSVVEAACPFACVIVLLANYQ
jgi:hypothetical protein